MSRGELHPGILTAPAAGPDGTLRCETAIVGSGPGGAVAAALLAGAGRDVLVLEEGPYLPSGTFRPYSRAEMAHTYRNGGVTLALGSPKVTYVEGRCVGGGSEVNAGLFYRTPDEVLERWVRDFAVAELTPSDLKPHFESVERELGVGPAPGPEPEQARRIREGAERLGFRSVDSPTSFRQRDPRDPDGPPERASMSRTYLPRALDAGARLAPDTRVVSLRREGRRWRLRCVHREAREVAVVADRVFVACGAVQTPALLRRSGIRRNVGNTLGLQSTLKVTARFPEPVNGAVGVPTWAVDEFAPRFHFTCAVSSPGYLALEMIQYPEHFEAVERDRDRLVIYSARINGGQGWVRAAPGFRDPIVVYRHSDRDMADLAEAARTLCHTLLAAGAETLFPSVLIGEPIEGADDVRRLLARLPRRRTNLMTIHLSSSCPMGEDRARCATDSFGKVHGADDLYVADASLLCTTPTVNPQGSIMAVVRRNVLRLLGDA